MIQAVEKRLGLEIGEVGLLAAMWLFSATLFVASLSYDGFTAYFPQVFAALVIVGTTMLLFQNYLPEPLYSFTAESVTVLDEDDVTDEVVEAGSDVDDEVLEETDVGDETDAEDETDRGLPLELTGMIGGYLVLSFFIGILWATPVFVGAYSYRQDHPLRLSLLLIALTFGLVLLFLFMVNVPADVGYIHDVLGIA